MYQFFNFLSEILIELQLKIFILKIRKKNAFKEANIPSCLFGISIGS